LPGALALNPTAYMVDKLYRGAGPAPASAAGATNGATGTTAETTGASDTATSGGATNATMSNTTEATTETAGNAGATAATPNRAAAGSTPSASDTAEMRGESTRLLLRVVAGGEAAAADRTYLAQLIANRTGVSQAEAEQRIDGVVAEAKAAEVRAREAVDTARAAGVTFSLVTVIALLLGALVASGAATLGGRQRDQGDLVPSE